MAGITLKKGLLTGKGVALKQKLAGAVTGLGLLLPNIGGAVVAPQPIGDGIGLFSYAPPAGVTGSVCYVRDKASQNNVRTLWNNRKETSTASRIEHWDGRLFDLSKAPTGDYEIVVEYYTITDTYEGGFGNPSFDRANMEGMWRGYDFIYDGVQIGTKLFFCKGYVEGSAPLNSIDIGVPQSPQGVLDGHDFSGQTLRLLATDEVTLFGTAYRTIGNKQSYVYSTSATAPGAITRFASLDQQTTNLDNIIGGLAVQKSGNLVVITYPALNRICTYRKDTKALLQTITTFTTPGTCTVNPQDQLVLKTGTSTVAVYPLNADGTIGSAVVTLPAETANPGRVKMLGNLMLVSDDGYAQQVLRAYNADGTLAWALGETGGHNTDSRALPTRFCFATANKAVNWSGLVPQKNGQFWVLQPGSNRAQLFNADRTPVLDKKLGVISYRTNCYNISLNQTDPTDLFWKYQRYKLGYSDSVGDDGVFTHNYIGFAPASQFNFGGDHGDQQNIDFKAVLTSLYTDSLNGRTYAYCAQKSANGDVFQEFEITASTLRAVGSPSGTPYGFDQMGARVVSRYTGTNNVNYSWQVEPRTGFDASGNRILGALTQPTTLLGVNPDREPYDPTGYPNTDARLKTEGGYRPLYLPNLIRRVYGKVVGDNFHLGFVKEGNTRWDVLVNKGTGGISYVGGQPLDGSYTTGDHNTFVLVDDNNVPILDANGKQIFLSQGYGGGVVRVSGRFVVENVYGEFYHDGLQNQRFLWTERGSMLYAFGTNTDESRAYTALTGKNYFPSMAGGVHNIEIARHPTNTNILYILSAGESGSGAIDRTRLQGLDTLTAKLITTFSVKSSTVFVPRYPTGTVNLLAKMPAKGDIWRPAKTVYENPGCGWTQSRPDDSTNKFGGGNYWKAEIGTHTYDIFDYNGIYIRYRFKSNGTLDKMSWLSDAFATNFENWEMLMHEHYIDGNSNNGEIGQASSGGLYRHLLDASGKILVRYYLLNKGNGNVAIMANNQTLVMASAVQLTPLWYQLRAYQAIRITKKNGVITAQYADYPAVTLGAPFDTGADWSSKSMQTEYVAWDNGNSQDRTTALKKPIFIPLTF